MNFKEAWNKIWFVLWKDDSLKGWIISLVFLFIFIKFIFFPGLSFVTSTELPLAIVESCSMYHNKNGFMDFDNWWERNKDKYAEFGLKKQQFQEYPMKSGFNKGDILFIIGTNPEKLHIGDIIIFNGDQKNPLIHRITKVTRNSRGEYTFETIGDNNKGQLSVEQNIKQEQIIGKAVFKVAPFFGWGKLIFFEKSRAENQKGFCSEK